MDPDLIVPDPSLTIRDGAVEPWASGMERGEGWTFEFVEHLSRSLKIDLDTPWAKLPKRDRDVVMLGTEAVGSGTLLADRVRGGGEPALPALQVHRLRGHAALLHALLLGQAVPDLRRRAAQAREPRRAGSAARGSSTSRASPSRRRTPGWPRLGLRGNEARIARGAPQGDPQPPQVPARRGPRLPHPRPPRAVALRRREPAHPARLADGLRAHRRHLHPRRALHRPPPARQRQAPRDAEAPARHRQLRHRRRARRGDHGGGRLARGLRARAPARTAARSSRPGHARGGEARPRLAHRRLPLRPARDRGPGAAPRERPRRHHDRRRAGEQPEGPHGLLPARAG